jgi:hypothetical protein
MITVSHTFQENPRAAGPRLALCIFAAPADAGAGERMQVALAVRYMQQQLARLGARVELAPQGAGDEGIGDEVDALVVFPAFCPSAAALGRLLAGADRPALVMALRTGFDDDGELAADYGYALDAIDTGAAPPLDEGGFGPAWIDGTLFDVHAWFEAGEWLSALRASLTLARRGFAAPPERSMGARESACLPG